MWGDRQSKYKILSQRLLEDMEREPVSPSGEYYLFLIEDELYAEEWIAAISLTDVFEKYSTGTETGFDKLLVDFDMDVLRDKIAHFSDPQVPSSQLKEEYDIKSGHAANLLSARTGFDTLNARQYIQRFQMRAYDYRFAYLKKNLLKTNSFGVMKELRKDAPGLVATRQTKENLFLSICP